MFNFTTQTVYNEIKTTAGAGRNVWLSGGAKPALRIGNTRFDAADIESIQVKLPTVGNLSSVTFDMTNAIPSKGSTSGRIVLYIGLSMNSQDSFYANDYVYKGKPLFIEFPVSSTDSPDVVAARVKKIAEKYLLFSMGSEKILDVTAETTAADSDNNVDAEGTVTFTGVNGYQQIKKAVLQLWNPEAITVDCCTRSGTYEDKVIGVPVIYTTSADGTVTTTETKVGADGSVVDLASNEVAIAPGLEAFGDYNWIIHNLRLPTLANTNFWSPTNKMGEMPVPGQVYTQFIITIKKERDGIMGEIVGARGTSVTTHVLYVAGAAALNPSTTTTAADKVYKELNTLASAKIVKSGSAGAADTVLQAPFASLTD